jgi:hypothetical protein
MERLLDLVRRRRWVFQSIPAMELWDLYGLPEGCSEEDALHMVHYRLKNYHVRPLASVEGVMTTRLADLRNEPPEASLALMLEEMEEYTIDFTDQTYA